MTKALFLAGLLSAHSILSVSDGQTLIPIYGYYNDKGEPVLTRLIADRIEEGMAIGQERLDTNPDQTSAAVLIYDGRIPLETGKIDALILEVKSYGVDSELIALAIPYTPATPTKPLALHKPKILDMPEYLADNINDLFEHYFQGVDNHEEGAPFWNAHYDGSK